MHHYIQLFTVVVSHTDWSDLLCVAKVEKLHCGCCLIGLRFYNAVLIFAYLDTVTCGFEFGFSSGVLLASNVNTCRLYTLYWAFFKSLLFHLCPLGGVSVSPVVELTDTRWWCCAVGSSIPTYRPPIFGF